MNAKIIDGKKLAEEIAENIQKDLAQLRYPPTLAIVRVGDDEASGVYIKYKKKFCDRVGVNYKIIEFPQEVSQNEVIGTIKALNQDSGINSILVQLPLPAHLDAKVLINTISPIKDVDGLTDINKGHLYAGNPIITPATPLAVMKIIEHVNYALTGKNAVIIGRSDLVGKPTAFLLIKKTIQKLLILLSLQQVLLIW
jgi:methylenetetrahydrofolate dehydrogenase (NADP+)/methenyltetrahydrofolate cyclohydrolase